jgi:hypothetical protein
MEEGGIVNAYGRMKEAVKEAADTDRRIQGRVRYMSDHILKELSNRQKRLTVKIYGKSMRTADQIADLKARRKEIFKEMTTRMIHQENGSNG